MKEVIQNRKKHNRFIFEIRDDDALMLSGQYRNMFLSDIFIINPGYLDWIINFDKADPGLKMVCKMIKKNFEITRSSISREIALN